MPNTCTSAAGSLNDSTNPNGGLPTSLVRPPGAYVPPTLCEPSYSLTDECSTLESEYQEQLAAENLAISGALLNVFKLLGIHEQGRLVDLTGHGHALGSGTPMSAFDALSGDWVSAETGASVVTTPAYIGYDFGARKTSYGQPETVPDSNVSLHVTSFRISQGGPLQRALQVRVDRSDGGYSLDASKIQFTGAGNGTVSSFVSGASPSPGSFVLIASSPTLFSVMFTGPSGTSVLGLAHVGVRFNSTIGSFTIHAGTIPFAANDLFTVPIDLAWKRVDVVNLPNASDSVLIRIRQSAPSRYWRLVPLNFTGAATGDSWVVSKLEFFDFQQTRLDDVQDTLYLENRDRSYASASIQIKAAYTPFDAVSDLSKFGFNIADVYTFTTTFATMVAALGRPIVVGDVLEVPAELAYDHNLKPVRKFLEVSDVSWSAEGFTTNWRPVLYRFQAQVLLPSQEHRDILGTADTQKYVIDDGTFFEGVQQIQTASLTAAEQNTADAITEVPRSGTNTREQMSGTNRNELPGSFDGVGPYVQSGLPPNGAPFITVFNKLPDPAGMTDGAYVRLEFDPATKIPARLYKFSLMKNKFIFVERDARSDRSSHRPSQQEILNRTTMLPMDTKRIV